MTTLIVNAKDLVRALSLFLPAVWGMVLQTFIAEHDGVDFATLCKGRDGKPGKKGLVVSKLGRAGAA